MLMLTLSLALASVIPAAGTDAYAAAGTDDPASEPAAVTAVPTEDSGEASVEVTEEAEPKPVVLLRTTITGYSRTRGRVINKSFKVSATITPARSRTVKLQRYNSSKKTWKTVMTKKAGSGESSKVTFSVPKKLRKKTTSLWRIYVPETDQYKAATSKKISLTTRNIKKVKLTARAAVIYRIDKDGSGTIIYTKARDKKLAQASTTKLMTAVLLLESGRLKGKTKISKHAAATPWGSGHLEKGDVFKTRDLLYAMLLPSSNDAATAVAERVGGSESEFVRMMNAKAKAMGLKSTQFRNPHGLDANGHYTTAYELAKLTAYAYTFPEIRKCWATKAKTINCVNRKKSWKLWSTNAIFSYVKEFLGGKTGTEDNAKCCFTGVYTYKGATYVTVVLGSNYGFARWSDTKKLHKYIRKYAATKY